MPEEQTEALNEQPEQAPTVEPSPVQETEPVAQEPLERQEDDTSEKPTRAQRRISELTRELKEAKAQAEARAAQAQATDFFSQTPEQDPWQQYESGEITMDQLKQVVSETSRGSAEFAAQKEMAKLRQELAEREFWGSLESDIRQMEATNPKFNPKSPDFDEEYVEELSELYKDAYGKDVQSLMRAPKLSQFVSRIEKLRAKAEAAGVERSSAQLAQQAAEGAVIGTTPSQTKRDPVSIAKQKGHETGDYTELFKSLAD